MKTATAVLLQFEEFINAKFSIEPSVRNDKWVIYNSETMFVSGINDFIKVGCPVIFVYFSQYVISDAKRVRAVIGDLTRELAPSYRSLEFLPDGEISIGGPQLSHEVKNTVEVYQLTSSTMDSTELLNNVAFAIAEHFEYPNNQYELGSQYLLRAMLKGE